MTYCWTGDQTHPMDGIPPSCCVGGHNLSMYFVRMANQHASTIRETTHGNTASGIVAANSPMVRLADIPLFFQYVNVT